MRQAEMSFVSQETEVRGQVNLDRDQPIRIAMPVPFFAHLVETLAFYGGFSLEAEASFRKFRDEHHLAEDTGLALGEALRKAEEKGTAVHRFGFFSLPMDEALVTVAVDLSRRPLFCLNGLSGQLQPAEVDLLESFGWGLARSLQATIHFKLETGQSSHHIMEAFMKALGFSLRQALIPLGKDRVFSTKGKL